MHPLHKPSFSYESSNFSKGLYLQITYIKHELSSGEPFAESIIAAANKANSIL
jgi:hypothetical protein